LMNNAEPRSLRDVLADAFHWSDGFHAGESPSRYCSQDADEYVAARGLCRACGMPRGTTAHALACMVGRCDDPDAGNRSCRETSEREPLTCDTVMRYDTVMKASELVKYAKTKGWTFVRQGAGSHVIYEHPDHAYILSLPMHGSKDLPTGTLAKLIKQIDGTWRL